MELLNKKALARLRNATIVAAVLGLVGAGAWWVLRPELKRRELVAACEGADRIVCVPGIVSATYEQAHGQPFEGPDAAPLFVAEGKAEVQRLLDLLELDLAEEPKGTIKHMGHLHLRFERGKEELAVVSVIAMKYLRWHGAWENVPLTDDSRLALRDWLLEHGCPRVWEGETDSQAQSEPGG